MLAGLSSRQMAEWMAYAAVEPFGEARHDYRMAHALAVILNFFQGSERAPIAVSDLMPQVGALADDDRAAALGAEDDGEEDLPPKHPNVILFEQMIGL